MIITKKHIPINKYTRVGRHITPTHIVIHWTATPGATALGICAYFGSQHIRKHPRYASTHYVVGIQGEVIEMVPPNEYCRHVGASSIANEHKEYTPLAYQMMKHTKKPTPSYACLGIELCHTTETGEFRAETLNSTIDLCCVLCDTHSIPKDAIVRHYDITRKHCPKYFVDHEDAWHAFLSDIATKRTCPLVTFE